MKTSPRTKTSPVISKSSRTISKKASSPTRTSPRFSKPVSLKAEENRNGGARQQVKSRGRKTAEQNEQPTSIQIPQQPQFIYQSYRDNPLTSNINSGSFRFSDQSYLDSCRCQMLYEELNIDFYPSAVRAIENSENDSAIDALHNVENIVTHIKW